MTKPLDARLRNFLESLVSSKHHDLLEMLTEDAIMEFPYHLPTTPTQLAGKQEIVKFFAGFAIFLTLDEIRLVAAHQTGNPNVAILEYAGIGKAVQTGKPYQQDYITVLTFRKNQIAHWKDYWNPVRVLNATAQSGSTLS